MLIFTRLANPPPHQHQLRTPGFQWQSGGGQEINIEDLFGGGSPFGDIFGRNPNAPRKGSDLQTEITVSFMEAAVTGVERDIDLSFQTQNPMTGQVTTERRNVKVNVPPGVNDGMNLRVAGQGGERMEWRRGRNETHTHAQSNPPANLPQERV